MRLLRDVNGQLPAREQLDAMKATLDERDTSLQAKQKEVEALLAGSPSALEVREQETYWHAFSNRRRRHAAATAGLGQYRAVGGAATADVSNRNGL